MSREWEKLGLRSMTLRWQAGGSVRLEEGNPLTRSWKVNWMLNRERDDYISYYSSRGLQELSKTGSRFILLFFHLA